MAAADNIKLIDKNAASVLEGYTLYYPHVKITNIIVKRCQYMKKKAFFFLNCIAPLLPLTFLTSFTHLHPLFYISIYKKNILTEFI